jgi:hypothetical protein
MLNFMRAMLSMPRQWVLWVMVLMLVNAGGGIVFFSTLEGKTTLVVFLLSAGLLLGIFAMRGFVRLLGAGHFLWFGLVPWLAYRYGLAPEEGWLQAWMAAVMVLNSLSLVIDVTDVVRYLRGEQDPTVALPD